MEVVGDKMYRHFAVSCRLSFGELDEARDEIVVSYDNHAPGVPDAAVRRRLSEFVGPDLLHELKAGQVIAVEDMRTDPRTAAEADAYTPWDVRSELLASTLIGGHLAFVLAVQHNTPHTWRPDEIELLGLLAERIYRSIEKARAEEALRRARNELEQRVQARTQELTASREELRTYARRLVEAVENERRNLARELHDQAAQSYVGAQVEPGPFTPGAG